MRKSLAIVALLTVTPSTASAATLVADRCVSVSSAAGCFFSGNINTNKKSRQNGYLLAQQAYNLYNDTVFSAGDDIELKPILGPSGDPVEAMIDGVGETSGSWSLPGHVVSYFAVKASNSFVLYKIAPSSTGNWTTINNVTGGGKKGRVNVPAMSNLVFFGDPIAPAVPEPATWAMMIIGLGAAGVALRRHRSREALLRPA